MIITYDPVRCETHVGDFVISDMMLAEMGISIEDFLERVDFTARSKHVRVDLNIPS